ncbi:MAG: gas vesicle protein [Euryarchaeota archaeon]|nr:gas vesicle protein [Euryarchaeota archaeon]
MKPERENNFVDLLDRLLNKGLVLNADLIISVAGVPLIGISLKAALASIETMLDYGMMEAWDQSTREWYANHCMKNEIPIIQDETIIYRTFGSIWHSQGIIHTWRPGFWYLTNKRLLLWRKEPAEMLFETPLEKIEGLAISREVHFQKEREEIYLQFDGKGARIHVSNTREFKEALESVGVLEKEFSIPCERVPLPEGGNPEKVLIA